jgi:hypothetical protein
MKKIVLLFISVALLGMNGCSILVNADRSKVKDDLYMPTPDGGAAVNGEQDAGAADAGTDAASEDAG